MMFWYPSITQAPGVEVTDGVEGRAGDLQREPGSAQGSEQEHGNERPHDGLFRLFGNRAKEQPEAAAEDSATTSIISRVASGFCR